MPIGWTPDEQQLCVDGEVCANDHEPQFGHCILCSAIIPCISRADLECNVKTWPVPGLAAGGYTTCRGRVALYPYIQQAELRAAYRLGGIPAVEAIVRPRVNW